LVLGDLITTDGSENTGWYYKPSLLFAINKDTEYPVQSAMLLNFLYNDPDGVEILGTTRGIPVSETALQTLSDLGTLDGLAYQSNEQILSSDPILISPYMENSDMQTYYNDAIEAVSLELLTPEEASQGLYANIVYALDSLKEGN
jgi:oligogalacturonide transport system substrate-binding protein